MSSGLDGYQPPVGGAGGGSTPTPPLVTGTSGASTGTVNGSLTFAAGKFGNGCSGWTSNGNYIQLASGNFEIRTTDDFTMEAWIKTSSGTLSVAAAIGVHTQNQAWIGVNTGGNFGCAVGGSALVDSGINVHDNAWHHVAMVVSGQGLLISTYVDGVAGNTHAMIGYAMTGVGRIGDLDAGGFPFTGAVDEFAVWNYARYDAAFTPADSP